MIVVAPQDIDSFKSLHLPRLRAAKIPGFEGTKLLNLELNRKLKAKNEDPVDLEKDCP
jgi:hypothetical protein